MRKKLTKIVVDKIAPGKDKDIFVWDTEVKGFGIRIRNRDKVYVAQARVSGRTVRKVIGRHGVFTPEQARALAKTYLGEMQKGEDINKKEKQDKCKAVTLKQAYEEYKSIKNLAANTIRGYQRAMETSFKDWQDKKIVLLNRDMIENRFKAISLSSPSVANLDFRFLRALLNFSMEKYAIDGEPLIASNPCNRLSILRLWNRIERRSTYIPPSRLPAFFLGLTPREDDSEQTKIAKNQCKFILFTGCREQEAARLKRQDIDFQERTVIFINTKNHKKHVLPTGDWLLDFLKRLTAGKKPSDYVFPANNKSGHIKDHQKKVKEISDKSGVDFSLHDIRRTFASIINHHLGQSFSPYTIKRILNHSGQDVTSGYIQFGVEDLRRPMQMIEDFILESAGIKMKDTVVEFPASAKRA